MSVASHVHRHTVYTHREIRAMVEVKTAQEVLVGFSRTTVLGHHHARDEFEYFTGAQHWAFNQGVTRHPSLRSRDKLSVFYR